MTAQIIDGKMIAHKIAEEIAEDVKQLFNQKKITPKLTVIIVGQNPASMVYVRNKKLACEKVGMLSNVIELEEAISEEKLINVINQLNTDKSVHGILVQLPLPKHINEDNILLSINPKKDVDAFHPFNTGRILNGKPEFEPCTPAGVIEILKYLNIQTSGKHVVIIGRSNIVGKPLAALFLQKGPFGDATVTICHSKTKNIEAITKQADILVAAIGSPNYLKANMVKKSAVVIDVGINRIVDENAPKGSRLVGDVDFEDVKTVASIITPVPGGVGPMTIVMLLKNTLKAAKK